MRIPVFVSCLTQLNPSQEASQKVIIDVLDELHLEPRALGRWDYPGPGQRLRLQGGPGAVGR